jgi:hypothetical protein
LATQRRPADTDAGEIREPDTPEIPAVDPSVEDGVTPGVSTMKDLFGQPHVLDEVRTVPYYEPEPEGEKVLVSEFWVIRTRTDIEDMTVGVPIVHMSFKAGTRYRVPWQIASELQRLDYLMEQPYPYDERALARRR